jgi:phosphoacetylglucosamine mutase
LTIYVLFCFFADDQNKRCASIDGDADRLVYHYFDSHGVWHLIDGDKIATLAAVFLADQLQSLGLTVVGTPNHKHSSHGSHGGDAHAASGPLTQVSVGVVQTAYANGASSRFIRDTLHLPVPLAKTGVKFVHHAAQEYDIGVYFEANGHGTILFHPEFLTALKSMETGGFTPAQSLAHKRLIAASKLINQAVGDALSDSMFIEAVLTLKKWSVLDWDAIYADLPSRQAKLAVPDRNAVKVRPPSVIYLFTALIGHVCVADE